MVAVLDVPNWLWIERCHLHAIDDHERRHLRNCGKFRLIIAAVPSLDNSPLCVVSPTKQ
jgi:hypothetical protein